MPTQHRRPTPRLAGKRDHRAMEVRRMNAMSLLDGGMSQSAVARELGVSRQAVNKWVGAKKSGGAKALRSKGKPGRTTALTALERKRVDAALLRGPIKNGYRNDLWTLRRIGTVIARVTGRRPPSTTRTWNILREMEWSCQRPARRARQQDANAVTEFREQTWVALKKTPININN
jgi:transposase